MRTFILILSILFTLSCEDNSSDTPNSETPSHEALDIVTGINLRDANGSPIGQIGNPNVYTPNIFIFPNPAVDVLTISSQSNLEEIWILPATKNTDFEDTDFEALTPTFTYLESDLAQAEIMNNQINSNLVQINLAQLEKGYYRVFYKHNDGTLKWDNIYTDKTANECCLVQTLIDEW